MFEHLNEQNEAVRNAMEIEARRTPKMHILDLWLRARRSVFSRDFLAVDQVCSAKFQSNRDPEDVDQCGCSTEG